MRANRLFIVGAATGLGLASLLAVDAPAEAGTSASDCVSVHSAELSTGLSFDIANGCEKRLSCALSWSLTCANASGKTTSKTKQEAKFVIGASDSHQTMGSSATCKDSWTIDDVAWECAPVTR